MTVSRYFSKTIRVSISLLMGIALGAVLYGCAPSPSNVSDQQAEPQSSPSSQATASNIETHLVVIDPDNENVNLVEKNVDIPNGGTVYDALEISDIDINVQESQYGKYLVMIDGISAEGSSGWVYTVNDKEVMESIDTCKLEDGDTIKFEYITM